MIKYQNRQATTYMQTVDVLLSSM